MTNEELIKELQKLPKDAEVKVFSSSWREYFSLHKDDIYYNEEEDAVEIT